MFNPPKYLSKEAKKYWKQLEPRLVALGTLTENDLEAFEVLCNTMEEMDLFRQGVLLGPTIEIGNKVMKNPDHQNLAMARAAFKNLSAKFGMTHGDRQKMKLNIAAKKNELDEFLKG